MGYSNYTRARARNEFIELLRHLNVLQDIMYAAGEPGERMAKLDTIRRKTQKLMGRVLDGIE